MPPDPLPAAPPSPIDVALVVDDHPLFCDALSITLRAAARIPRVETADSLAAALDRLGQGGIGLVVLDLNLPDVSGLDGLIRLRRVAGDVPVLVVSSLADGRVVAGAMQAGAAGFVPKHSQRDMFRRAIEAVAEGRTFLPEDIVLPSASTPCAPGREDAIRRLRQLTRQQARILELICEGRLNKQIAWELSIADATVKAHVTAIMRKLGVQTRTQAVLMAREVSFASLLREGGDGH